MSDLSNVQNLIFDLGNVIINIDLSLTYQAFARHAGANPEAIFHDFQEKKIFPRYELGEFSDPEFRDFLRSSFGNSLTDLQIDTAWNELLLDIPAERIKLIQKLRDKYNLYLLSNTNSIHIKEVNNILHKATGVSTLELLFDKVYLSYEINLAKPGVEIYHHVIQDAGLEASRSLFLDDNADNVAGAQKAGLQAVQVTPEYTILEILAHA